jgi:hypothetical protein
MSISKKRLTDIAAIPDDAIDTSDTPEATEDFFKNARLKPPPSAKRAEPASRGKSAPHEIRASAKAR